MVNIGTGIFMTLAPLDVSLAPQSEKSGYGPATAAPARHERCAFQASTENIYIREFVNHGALWLFAVLRLRNTLTYLLTYKQTNKPTDRTDYNTLRRS